MAPLGPFGPALMVGCSGGPDSLALMWLAHGWAPGRVTALVCDHGLRAESAAEAAATVAQLAARGIPARLLPLGLAPGPRTQERARAARRAALLGACAAAGALHLLLAHHAEDQAETILMRALAGSGAIGLGGMSALIPAAEALVLRPLLGVPRARLRATCAAAGLRWLDDPANADRRFLRARLRQAPPRLDAAPFARRRQRLEAALAERLAAAAALEADGTAWLDLAALGADALARLALGRLVRAVGGGRHPPAPAAVAALLARGHGSLGGAVLRRDGRLRPEARIAPGARASHLKGLGPASGPLTLCFVPPLPPCQSAADTLSSSHAGRMAGKEGRAT
ncbi:tRNA lysidine(34) synthetase TilS [Roseococcus sp. DSY-14]|uniref:tRNA lysidine(34) synthetase TilS n=1 Tax=Roseococcus sp. DSY-14 TaxID=3369650 RepID=UPI00387AE62D